MATKTDLQPSFNKEPQSNYNCGKDEKAKFSLSQDSLRLAYARVFGVLGMAAKTAALNLKANLEKLPNAEEAMKNVIENNHLSVS